MTRPSGRWLTNAELERAERVLDRLADRGGPPPTQADWDLIGRALGELGAKRALVGRLHSVTPRGRWISSPGPGAVGARSVR